MTDLETISSKISLIKPILKKEYGLKSIGIFGSYVRGEQNKKSDLDILVDFNQTVSLFEFVRLRNYLTKELHVKVDLVMKSALKKNIGKNILHEVLNA